jgi:hypothetical protein
MKAKIEKCPYCGSTEGFYTLTDYLNVPYRYGFNGEDKYNGEMYDQADCHQKRYAYCMSCNAKIGTANQLLKQINAWS